MSGFCTPTLRSAIAPFDPTVIDQIDTGIVAICCSTRCWSSALNGKDTLHNGISDIRGRHHVEAQLSFVAEDGAYRSKDVVGRRLDFVDPKAGRGGELAAADAYFRRRRPRWRIAECAPRRRRCRPGRGRRRA